MIKEFIRPIGPVLMLLAVAQALLRLQTALAAGNDPLDRELAARLQELGFTANIEATLEKRLGRSIAPCRTCSSRRPSFLQPNGRKPPALNFLAITTRFAPKF